MRVLVAEDDQKIAAFIVNGLKQAGFAVNHAADGENGLHWPRRNLTTWPSSTSCCPNWMG